VEVKAASDATRICWPLFFTNIISFSAYRMAMNKQEGIEKPSFVITLTV
jgi:hypothetical protein